jgi:3-methyladenine DNA glycosylase/8-oxoguanine DNA glycosylase
MKEKHNITQEAVTHLRSTSKEMNNLIDLIGDIESYYIVDHFTALTHNVIYQSISFKAATAIWNRFMCMFDKITPENILAQTQEKIKSVGISNSKAEYIRNIAYAFHHKTITLDFANMDDEEVKSELQKIRGIGPWTSEMFLIFCLNRPNVLSYGDIAIRKGLEKIYQIDHNISKNEFLKYQSMFHPYNTTASFFIWELTLRDLLTKPM